MKRGMAMGLALLALLGMQGGEAWSATYGEALDLDGLSAQSHWVVRGAVQRVESVAGGPGIVTEVTIRVEETLLGTPLREVVVVVPGGALGGRALSIPGAPRFWVDEEVVVFLDEAQRLVGFGQGVFAILEEQGYRVVEGSSEPVVSLPEIRRAVR